MGIGCRYGLILANVNLECVAFGITLKFRQALLDIRQVEGDYPPMSGDLPWFDTNTQAGQNATVGKGLVPGRGGNQPLCPSSGRDLER